LYFLGLSLRITARALQPFAEKRRSFSVWIGYKDLTHFQFIEARISAFIIDDTMIRVESKHV
jgi:hypothetical protein